jgi:hypothetical protein
MKSCVPMWSRHSCPLPLTLILIRPGSKEYGSLSLHRSIHIPWTRDRRFCKAAEALGIHASLP